MYHTQSIIIMEISATVLAQMRNICVPSMDGVRKDVNTFVAEFLGGKVRPNFWDDFNAKYSPTHDVMVCIGHDKKVRILEVRYDRRFARYVGELLKSAKILWAKGDKGHRVDWANWKSVYSCLTAPADTRVYDEYTSERKQRAILAKQKREADFYDLARPDRYKKVGKRGYNMSFDEMRAEQRQERYEQYLRGTLRGARTIMGAL